MLINAVPPAPLLLINTMPCVCGMQVVQAVEFFTNEGTFYSTDESHFKSTAF